LAPPSLGRKRPRKQTARQRRIAAMHNLVILPERCKAFFAMQRFLQCNMSECEYTKAILTEAPRQRFSKVFLPIFCHASIPDRRLAGSGGGSDGIRRGARADNAAGAGFRNFCSVRRSFAGPVMSASDCRSRATLRHSGSLACGDWTGGERPARSRNRPMASLALDNRCRGGRAVFCNQGGSRRRRAEPASARRPLDRRRLHAGKPGTPSGCLCLA